MTVWHDLRLAVRTLSRSPGFTLVAVATLALGIGSTAALFSVVDVALLHPLSAPDAARLVWLQEFGTNGESGGTPARLADWQKARTLGAVAGFYSEGLVIPGENGPLRLEVLRTFGDASGVLQPKVQLGRAATLSEARGDGPPVALLTARAFRQLFHSDPGVLNRSLRLGGLAYQVIGVFASQVNYPQDIDVWTAAPANIQRAPRRSGFLGQIARLTPGVSLQQAQAEIDLLTARLASQYPATDKGRTATLASLPGHISQNARKPLLILLAAVTGVLLIACANIAGLLLARGLTRRPEAAIRVALGAGFGRLARLFFTESLLLASVGCALGLALAYTGLDVLKALLPDDVPRLADAAIDGRVLLCGLALAFMAAFFFGGLPAWQFAATAHIAAIKEKSKTPFRGVLVIAEVALSLMLLVVAGLLANSFLRLSRQAAGFNPAQAYSFTVMFPWDSQSAALHSFSAAALDRLSAFPGSVAAGVVDRLPLHGGSQSSYIDVRGRQLPLSLAATEIGWRTASSGYFAAAGVPLLSGAIFRDPHEALISQRLAAALFPGRSPLGHEIAQRSRGDASPPEWFRITGVIGEVPLQPADPVPPLEVFVPWGSTFWPVMNFVVRTGRPLADLAGFVREQIQPLDKEQVFEKVQSLQDLTAETRSTPRVRALLMGCFSAVSLALAAIGLFGLMAQEVARRTQDFGVRIALGAEPRRIALDSLLAGLRLALVGLAVGLLGSFWISRLLTSLLFGVEPRDVLTYLAASFVLLATVALAALIPALRAARIDPIRALRHE